MNNGKKRTNSIGISQSLEVAIFFLMYILYRGKNIMHYEQLAKLGLPIPKWKNFIWFDQISPWKIIKGGKDWVNASQYQILRRQIGFYCNKQLIAKVWLRGNEFRNSDGSKPTFWRVVKIKYRQQFDPGTISHSPEWFEAKFTDEQMPII